MDYMRRPKFPHYVPDRYFIRDSHLPDGPEIGMDARRSRCCQYFRLVPEGLQTSKKMAADKTSRAGY